MFIDNKYKKWYDRIIENALGRNLTGYTENHHIIPKSLGGTNNAENLIALTAREHFICHLLLTKMLNDNNRYRMYKAFNMMLTTNKREHQRYRPTSRYYEMARKLAAEAISHHNKGKAPWNKGTKGICKGNPGLKHTMESKQKISDARAKQVIKHSAETKQKMSEAAKKRWARQKELSA